MAECKSHISAASRCPYIWAKSRMDDTQYVLRDSAWTSQYFNNKWLRFDPALHFRTHGSDAFNVLRVQIMREKVHSGLTGHHKYGLIFDHGRDGGNP